MDSIDEHILDILRSDARAPVSRIARLVGLSSAPVSRRIERMESDGTIRGYVTIVDDEATGELDAFTEIRLTGDTDTRMIEEIALQVPEVQEYYSIAGDPDALVRFRVRGVDHLQQVVNAIRRTGMVAGTRTLIVMSAWDRTLLSSRRGSAAGTSSARVPTVVESRSAGGGALKSRP